MDDLQKFLTAAISFGEKYYELKANEYSFQAWFAYELVKQFSEAADENERKYVYRDIQFYKKSFSEVLGKNKDELPKNTIYEILVGDSIRPDIVIPFGETIDARYTDTRKTKYYTIQDDIMGVKRSDIDKRKADKDILAQLSIISELKVTSSVKNQSLQPIIQDLQKLAIFSASFVKIKKELKKDGFELNNKLIPIMIILDNNNKIAKAENILEKMIFSLNELFIYDEEIKPSFAYPIMLIIKKNDNGIEHKLYTFNTVENKYESNNINYENVSLNFH